MAHPDSLLVVADCRHSNWSPCTESRTVWRVDCTPLWGLGPPGRSAAATSITVWKSKGHVTNIVHQWTSNSLQDDKILVFSNFNPFPNKPWFLRVYGISLLKTLWEKEKKLVTSIFSFSHGVFYSIKEINHHLSNTEFVVCKCFQFGNVQNSVVWEKVKSVCRREINPIPHMPILGSSNSAANKNMVSKMWTNGDTII